MQELKYPIFSLKADQKYQDSLRSTPKAIISLEQAQKGFQQTIN